MNTSIVSYTETTITVQFRWNGAKVAAQYVSYALDGSTFTPAIPITPVANDEIGYYTVENLTPGTNYYVLLRASANGVSWSVGNLASVTTYNEPQATVTPDFVLGNSVTVQLTNPLNKFLQVQFLDCNGATAATWNGAVDNVSFGTVPFTDALYSSIPNATTAQYSIRVISADADITTTGGYYSINAADCAPTAATFSYADSNGTITAITQDNQKIVQNLSVPAYSLTGLQGEKYATISSVSVSVNGSTFNLTVSGSGASGTGGTVDSASNVIATATITDSRGVTATKTVELEMVAWTTPTAIINVGRQQNFYDETDVKVDADYTQVGTSTITINLVADAVPITGLPTPAQVTATLTDNVTSTVILDNLFAWNITLTLTDSFGATATFTAHIDKGIPITFVDRILRAYAVNGFPTHENSIEVFDGSYYKNGVDITTLFPVTQYNLTENGALTAATSRIKTYTVTGDGIVFISSSFRSGNNTWGVTKITIKHNNTDVAKDTDMMTADYNGQESSASASAFITVSNGDTITAEAYSTRYTSGNTWIAYYNVLAFGCTLTVS